MTEDVLTLDAIVATAQATGHGSPTALRRRFVEYQQLGLIGSPVRKESRRGGAGLWHPIQVALFDLYLRHPRKQFSLATLANVPIAFWLLSADGIETEQVQKGLFFQAGGLLPSEWERDGRKVRRPSMYAWDKRRGREYRERGDRSDLGQSIDRAVDRFSRPDTTDAQRRGLLKTLRTATVGLPESLAGSLPTVTRSTFVSAITDVRSDSREERAVAQAIYQMLSDRLLALSYLDALCSDTAAARAYWGWGREFGSFAMAQYVGDLPSLWSNPNIADLFDVPSLNAFITEAGAFLLGIFGSGIRWLRGDHGPGVSKHPPNEILKGLFSTDN